MRGLLIVLLTLAAGVGAAARGESASETASPWRFGLGVGLSFGVARDVNPAFGETTARPRVFALVRRERLGLMVEAARATPRPSASGGLTVTTETHAFGVWARYDVATVYDAAVFAAAGGGVHFDRVRTTFNDATDVRGGTRRYGGVGLGLSRTAWSYVTGEIEARVIGTETARAPGFTLDLRVGLAF